MTASKNSSTSAQAGTSAGSAGSGPAAQPMQQLQQMFDAWLNAWRGFADPARAATAPAAVNPFATFQFPQSFPFQMPAMPDFGGVASPFAGLKLPVAAIPPERLQALQADYARDCIALMQQATAAKLESPELKDRRFSGDAWKSSPAHAFAAAWYLLNARYLQELADALETDPKTRERIRFTVQQWTAAAAPSNFLALNPDAQKSILDTQGESLRQGMMNLLGDLQRGKISQTDESQFVVGKNLGCTEGAVVYENDLIQLIQYAPKTDKVFERPLLIVPPCINKFYILDLQPENSLVAHALSNGHQVFLVSWRNADASVAHKTWDDYMNEGLLAAIDAVQQISGREQINTLGFCAVSYTHL